MKRKLRKVVNNIILASALALSLSAAASLAISQTKNSSMGHPPMAGCRMTELYSEWMLLGMSRSFTRSLAPMDLIQPALCSPLMDRFMAARASRHPGLVFGAPELSFKSLFSTPTGGILQSSNGVSPDAIKFVSKKIAPRTYAVTLPAGLQPGEYGFLPPRGAIESNSVESTGRIYDFYLSK